MSNEELTENEAKVYDRQLRVWGVEVQRRYGEGLCAYLWGLMKPVIKVAISTTLSHVWRRLNAAKILIAGMTSGVAAEVRISSLHSDCIDRHAAFSAHMMGKVHVEPQMFSLCRWRRTLLLLELAPCHF